MNWATTDLCDAHEPSLESGTLRVIPLQLGHWGRQVKFAGPAETLRLFEDNSLVRKALSDPGQGRVLVVDGGGSMRCALVGGNLGKLAQDNGWAGIVVWGAVRDADELDACDVGIRALGLCPRRSRRRDTGERGVAVELAGVAVAPGQWVYADRDGVLVSDNKLA